MEIKVKLYPLMLLAAHHLLQTAALFPSGSKKEL
jgi:hypothetical protein